MKIPEEIQKYVGYLIQDGVDARGSPKYSKVFTVNLYVPERAIASIMTTWGIETCYFSMSRNIPGGTLYTVRVTEKFYYDFVLPEIVRLKPEKWMLILITDTVNRG